MSELKPWIPDELPGPTKKPKLVEEAKRLLPEAWEDSEFRALSSSTCREDSVTGSVTFDKALAAERFAKIAGPQSSLGREEDLTRVSLALHHAAYSRGVSRKQLQQRKAEYLAIDTATEPIAD